MGNKVIRAQAFLGENSKKCKVITLVVSTKTLGIGGYGVVRAAKLEHTGEKVAVKISSMTTNRENMDVRNLRELKHCNVIKMLYYFHKSTYTGMDEYIVMERMPKPLSKLYDRRTPIPAFDVKLYMYQVLRGLAYMHARNMCHQDIKPENVLVDPSTGVIKLCDFGVARNLSVHRCTPRAGTLHYRAPEMLMNFRNYTAIVDVWSAGCILVELLKGGTRLFHALTVNQQLNSIVKYFGTATAAQFPGLEPEYPFHRLPDKKGKEWSNILKPYPKSDDAISLCSGLVCYSPGSRLLPHVALAHNFFDELRSLETTHLANGNPLPPLFNFQPGEFPGEFDHLIPWSISSKNDELTGSVGLFATSNLPRIR